MMKVICIQNTTRKLRQTHKRFLQACKDDSEIEFHHYKTESANHAKELAEKAKGNCDILLVIGGDGTLNEVVNGLCIAPGTNPKIFLLPGGTGNDFHRNFLASDLSAQSPINLFSQKGESVQIACLQTASEKRYFINIIDIGFGGNVVRELNELRNKFGAGFSYFLAIIRTFFKYKKPVLTISYNGTERTQKFFMLAICNGPVFGNGLIISPGTNPRENQFGLVILGDVSLFDYLRNLPNLWRGKRISHPEINYEITDEVTISSSIGDVYAETDGEFIASTAFYVSFHTEILEFLT
jgi:YegS/Rv2252/BmrU family lipid kinase